MNSGEGRTSESLQVVRQLLEQIVELCGKISVAKRETSQLAELCNILSDCLSDRSQSFEYDDIKSILGKVGEQLTSWSKLNYPKSLMKKGVIEAGVAGFISELQAAARMASPVTGAGHDESLSHKTPLRHDAGQGILDAHPIETKEGPQFKQLDREITELKELASNGRYTEVWEGKWLKGRGEGMETEKVALEAPRTSRSQIKETNKKLEHALLRWANLRHENILPLYGVVTNIESRLCMVFPWRENGNVLEYVKKAPRPNKNHLLRGSAAGLSYLHSQGIIHGSVKCKNVLVSDGGEPQIWNFEIARIVDEKAAFETVSSGDTVRYAAPELIEINGASATTHSDTYSFAMLVLECITEEAPFSYLEKDAAVVHARITKRQSPARPHEQDQKKNISDKLWKYMTECWDPTPERRPSMEEVNNFFLSNQD